jgi:uncharacterized iron-regulated membrane protein
MNDVWKYFIALIIGLSGAMLFLSGYHLWLDHKFVDDIRLQIQQQQARPK